MEQLDLSKLDSRAIEMASELLEAYAEGVPETFNDTGVTLQHNDFSGNVFLMNNEYQVLVLRDGKLEQFYTLSYYGNEGTVDELWEQYQGDYIRKEDFEELVELLNAEGWTKQADEVKQRMEGE